MSECRDNAAIINRLKRIEGQTRGLIKMVEEGRQCEDVLVQISSAKAALHKTGQVILECHLRHCVLTDMKEGNEEEVMKKLLQVIEQFSRLI